MKLMASKRGTTWRERALTAEAEVERLKVRLAQLRAAYAAAQSELGGHDYGTGHPDDRDPQDGGMGG